MQSRVPDEVDYNDALVKISNHFNTDERVFSIFWSGWKEQKRRIPFSDIDLFIIERNSILPSFETVVAFWKLLEDIHPNVPVQIHWTSEPILRSPLCPEKPFLEETKQSKEWEFASYWYATYLDSIAQNRQFKNDDISMMSHYIRKIVNQTIRLESVKQSGDHADIVRVFWAYRKIFGLLSLIVRIKNGSSPFSNRKADIIESAQEIIGSNIIINADLLLTLDQPDSYKLLEMFHSEELEKVVIYFSQLYVELVKILQSILSLPVKVRVEEVLSF
ncbi:MAG: hypothetical protein ACD_3C00086G0022 [uncultured bacterium (gcode 4)]|uniref:Uncharacterized protein n=1 Tax=uncultured bacterium (gcode 4) TaxID=1234023 RepID=K2FZ26_9BACT|nr:MAG: hypothetical protein ACD_3C00086G0022 [uncultured bacterium (gcode 4)]